MYKELIMNIQYSKWNHKEFKQLNKSMKDILHIQEGQLYYPIMSLFLYIHNTKNSHRVLDFNRPQYIKEILQCENIKEYNYLRLQETHLT